METFENRPLSETSGMQYPKRDKSTLSPVFHAWPDSPGQIKEYLGTGILPPACYLPSLVHILPLYIQISLCIQNHATASVMEKGKIKIFFEIFHFEVPFVILVKWLQQPIVSTVCVESMLAWNKHLLTR